MEYYVKYPSMESFELFFNHEIENQPPYLADGYVKHGFHIFKQFPEMDFILTGNSGPLFKLYGRTLRISVKTGDGNFTVTPEKSDYSESDLFVKSEYLLFNNPEMDWNSNSLEKQYHENNRSVALYIARLLEGRPRIVEEQYTFRVPKIKTPNKYRREIKKVCFLYARRDVKKGKTLLGNGGSHSHKYDVSGHWRKVGGLGKDANGDYNQIGRTWVKNCIKGAGKYIYKPRVIINGNK